MKKAGRRNRRFSRGFKIAAVRRVQDGEAMANVARELELGLEMVWRWKKRVDEQGEDHLYDVGRRRGQPQLEPMGNAGRRRIAELERLVGHQQLEIRFLDKALRRVEESHQEKNDDGVTASSK
jgi:transposase-like protein